MRRALFTEGWRSGHYRIYPRNSVLNPPEKYGFSYDPQLDAFICPGRSSSYIPQAKLQQIDGQISALLPGRGRCLYALSKTAELFLTRLEFGAECYQQLLSGIFQRAPARGNPEYLAMMRLRKIWAEGSFSVLKREHCSFKDSKRGILAATEECPPCRHGPKPQENGKCHLSLSPNLLFCWNHCGFQQFFCFCQQVQYIVENVGKTFCQRYCEFSQKRGGVPCLSKQFITIRTGWKRQL